MATSVSDGGQEANNRQHDAAVSMGKQHVDVAAIAIITVIITITTTIAVPSPV